MSATASQRSEPPTVLGALGADLAGAEPEDLRCHPGGCVHAVGDRGDRDLVRVETRPQPGEHLAADVTVEQRHPVGPLAEPEPHHGHVEEVRLTARVGLHAEAEDPLDVDTGEFGVRAEVVGDQFAVEAVDAGGDGGVGGEDRTGADGFESGLEVQPAVAAVAAVPVVPVVPLGEFGDAFQAEEARVALVGVEHLGLGVAGQPAVRPYGAHPADAEQHLLKQPVLAAAAVQPVGHPAFAEVVLLDVGVEHEEGDATDLGQPDAGAQGAGAGEGEGDLGRGAVGFAQGYEREFVGVEDGIVLLLPAVSGEGLAEVAVPVEESYADEGYAEVAGGLEVVAGEDAEAAGVLGQGRGDAELG
jgi:hypothetical protein